MQAERVDADVHRTGVCSLVALANDAVHKSSLAAEGLEWRVLQGGQGEQALVFLPGALGSGEIFARQIEAFGKSRRVLVLGYPGCNDTARMTRSFLHVIGQLGVETAHLVGSSLGAYWLQVFTHAAPGIARSLVLGNTFVDAEPLQANPLFERAFLERTPAEGVKERWMAFLEQLPPSLLRELLRKLAGELQAAHELHGRLRTVAHAGMVPLSKVDPAAITVLSCDDDLITSEGLSERVHAAYPGANHVRLKRGGHYPHVNEPEAYNHVIAHACGLANKQVRP